MKNTTKAETTTTTKTARRAARAEARRTAARRGKLVDAIEALGGDVYGPWQIPTLEDVYNCLVEDAWQSACYAEDAAHKRAAKTLTSIRKHAPCAPERATEILFGIMDEIPESRQRAQFDDVPAEKLAEVIALFRIRTGYAKA